MCNRLLPPDAHNIFASQYQRRFFSLSWSFSLLLQAQVFGSHFVACYISTRHAQTSTSETLVRRITTIPRTLHSNLCLVVEPSGDLVQPDYAAGHSSRDVSQRQGTGGENRSICASFQRPRAAFRLDRHGGFDLRQSPATM